MANETKPVLRVAMVSSKNLPGEPEANVVHHARWIERALSQKAQFVGFPDGKIVRRSRVLDNRETMLVADLSFDGILDRREKLFSFTDARTDLFYRRIMKERRPSAP